MDNIVFKKKAAKESYNLYLSLWRLRQGKKFLLVILFASVVYFVTMHMKFVHFKVKKLDKSMNLDALQVDIPVLPDTKQPCSNPGFSVTLSDVPLAETAQKHPDMKVGGYWEPINCQARARVAIVIPYRDREFHLRVFLANIVPYLKLQQVAFSIFVINQVGNTLFNRGALVNVGYLKGRKIHNFTCLIMHDVDMLPLRLCNLYHCSPTGARHLGVSRNKNPPAPKYKDYIGGVMALSTNVFKRIHGLTNIMFGWGGEDTDLHGRLTEERINISKYPAKVANYTMIDHERDPSNPKSHRSKTINHANAKYRKLDGYSTLTYNLISVKKEALYTNITVTFNGPSTGPKAEAESMLFFNSKRAEFARRT